MGIFTCLTSGEQKCGKTKFKAIDYCRNRAYSTNLKIFTRCQMIKGKFGDAVRSKSDIGQLNEVLCKVLCHNLCVLIQAIHELGIEPRFDAKPSSVINPIFALK